jgi:polyisoprenoid-binding protein YceI
METKMPFSIGLRAGSFRSAALGIALATIAPRFDALAHSNWAIDPARTNIGFSIDAAGWPRTNGSFKKFDGRVVVDLDHPTQSRVTFHLQAQSVDVGSAAFSDYLRSEAFLNTAQFPTIDFASTSVEKIDDHKVRVAGNLSLLGVTRPINVDVDVSKQDAGGRMHLSFTAAATIDRLEFGMNSGYPVISRVLSLTISSEATEL